MFKYLESISFGADSKNYKSFAITQFKKRLIFRDDTHCLKVTLIGNDYIKDESFMIDTHLRDKHALGSYVKLISDELTAWFSNAELNLPKESDAHNKDHKDTDDYQGFIDLAKQLLRDSYDPNYSELRTIGQMTRKIIELESREAAYLSIGELVLGMDKAKNLFGYSTPYRETLVENIMKLQEFQKEYKHHYTDAELIGLIEFYQQHDELSAKLVYNDYLKQIRNK